jgi:hypothetical protein
MIVVPAWMLLAAVVLLLANAYQIGRYVEARSWWRRIEPEADRAGRVMEAAAEEIEQLRARSRVPALHQDGKE